MIGIAQRLNVPFEKLRDANPQIVDPNWIYPGDVLTVPEHAPAAIDVENTFLTGNHSVGNFLGSRVPSVKKQGEVLHAPDASRPGKKETLYQEAQEPKTTLMVSAGGGERKLGASRVTERRNGQWQKPEIERHHGERNTDKPAMIWEKGVLKIDSNESQKVLMESKYFNAKYEKGHEVAEVKARAVANSDGLNFGVVASSHKAAHRIAVSGGVDNLHMTADAEVFAYHGEIKTNLNVGKKGFKAEAGVGAGAHLVKGQATIALETPGIWGVNGRIICEGGAGIGIEGYLGASVEVTHRKAELDLSIAGSIGAGANVACSIGFGFYD